MFVWVRMNFRSRILILCMSLVLTHAGLALAVPHAQVVPMQLQQGEFISVQIPQLDSGFSPEVMSQLNELFRQSVLQRLQSFESIAYQTRTVDSMPESIRASLTFRAEYEVFRSDAQIISLIQRVYQYTGGAHGMTIQTGHTIDRTSGRQLTLANLFVTGANYAERINRFVIEEGRARKLPMWDFKGIGEKAAFYLSDTGIVLFFQQYEIAPYSAGIVQMQIPYELMKDILQPGLAH